MSTETVEEVFRRGCRAQEQGDLRLALSCFREAARAEPANPQFLFRLAAVQFQGGQTEEAAAQLGEVVKLLPDALEPRVRLAQVLSATARQREAAEQLLEAVRIDPANIVTHLNHAQLCLQAGDTDLALASFQRAHIMAPQLATYAAEARVPEPLRKLMRTALERLSGCYEAFTSRALEETNARFPGADLGRLRAGCESCGQPGLGDAAKQQKPELFCLPGLPAPGWYERDRLPWVDRVEALFPQIDRELTTLLQSGSGFYPYLSKDIAGTASGSSLVGSMAWNAFHFRCGDKHSEENCARCPTAASLADVVPAPGIRHYSPEVFFSRLRPGAVIEPHHGLMNIRLTAHLALRIPANTGIKVADQVRQWRPGKVLVFDDSVRHEAWNHGDEERIVLIFEAWNPDVADFERYGIERYFEHRRTWLDRFDDDPLMPPSGTKPRLQW